MNREPLFVRIQGDKMDKNELVKIKIKAEGGLPGRFWRKEYEFDLKKGQIDIVEFKKEGRKWVYSNESTKPINFSYDLMEECFERTCKILSSPTKEVAEMEFDSSATLTFMTPHSKVVARTCIFNKEDSISAVLHSLYTLIG